MRTKQLVIHVGVRELKLIFGLRRGRGIRSAAELPKAALIDHQRRVQFVQQLLELLVVEFEVPETNQLFLAGTDGAQRRLEGRTIAREDRVRADAVREHEADRAAGA